MGGKITAHVNLGDSCAQNSHAAFSAKVLLAREKGQRGNFGPPDAVLEALPAYPALTSLRACSKVIGFQSVSS